ncbi:DUF4275 family protein [Rossellomorea marisflavi]|uniref:DUF4275 family protein n=1 Tax=Rossellomorea marisflavi TaxID=189381 RepID=UPI00345880EA
MFKYENKKELEIPRFKRRKWPLGIRKHSCFIFFQDKEDALLLENASGFDVKDLSSEVGRDVYVVDKQFRWTFVLTHETDWLGPYFSRR